MRSRIAWPCLFHPVRHRLNSANPDLMAITFGLPHALGNAPNLQVFVESTELHSGDSCKLQMAHPLPLARLVCNLQSVVPLPLGLVVCKLQTAVSLILPSTCLQFADGGTSAPWIDLSANCRRRPRRVDIAL